MHLCHPFCQLSALPSRVNAQILLFFALICEVCLLITLLVKFPTTQGLCESLTGQKEEDAAITAETHTGDSICDIKKEEKHTLRMIKPRCSSDISL